MIIAINTLAIRPGKVGGTEVFLVNLIKNLLKIDKKNKYLIIVSKNNKKIFQFNFENVEYLEQDFDNSFKIARIFFEQFILPKKIKQKGIDVLISPTNTGLLYCPVKSLLIVHDLIYFIYPQYYSLIRKYYLQKLVQYSCKKAHKIIAISQNTKNDIIKYTGVSEQKIQMIHSGVDLEYFAKIERNYAKQVIFKKYGINDYIYSPVSLFPHKNIDVLVKVFNKVKKRKKISHKLIITGGDPFKKSKELEDLIYKYKLEDEIFYLGRVPQKMIPYFYKAADLMVYLSSYEGFGLPVLEAMASNCPVLSSDKASLPEIVGNAGLLVSPSNLEEIANKMYEILNNENLQKNLISRGVERVKSFSWEKTVKELINIYNDLK